MLFSPSAMGHNQCISLWLSKAVFPFLLLAAVHVCGVTIQNPFDVHLLPKEFVAGSSSLVSWTPTAEGTVSLKLFAGASRDMRYVSTVAHFIENKGNFAWTPSIALEAGEDYALLIQSDADDQLIDCSPPFAIRRPIINRQDAQSSFMSDFAPASAVPTEIVATPTPATNSAIPPSSLTTSLPTNVQTTMAATANTPTNSATSPQPTAQTSSSSGLSTGAAIGVGVGLTLVILIIALLVFFLLRRRRQKRQQPPVPEFTSSGPAELETSKSRGHKVTDLTIGGGWEAGKHSELEGGIAKPTMAEPSNPSPLSPEEYAELERRRRALELQGQSMGAVGAAELQGQAHPRAELEALRANSKHVHELGGHAIRS